MVFDTGFEDKNPNNGGFAYGPFTEEHFLKSPTNKYMFKLYEELVRTTFNSELDAYHSISWYVFLFYNRPSENASRLWFHEKIEFDFSYSVGISSSVKL